MDHRLNFRELSKEIQVSCFFPQMTANKEKELLGEFKLYPLLSRKHLSLEVQNIEFFQR